MSLGFAFALLLTLQSFQLVSTQTSNPGNGELTTSPISWIPDEGNVSVITAEKDVGISSGSMTSSGDYEYQAGSQTVRAVTGPYDDSVNTTPSPQTTLNVSSNTTENNATSIQENNNLVTLNPYLGPSTTNGSHVNLTETNITTPSPENSTTTTTTTTNTTTTNTTTTTTSAPAFNITQNSTSTVSGNFTTTSPPQLANYTKSPSENSTNTTVFTMTTMYHNHTSVVLLNESSTASTTKINATGGSFDVRGNVDRGLSSDIQQQTKSQAWGAILGIGIGVAIVALVIYIIVKRRNYRDFSHKKLVEDMPPEPVLRLDNSEHLDLKFDGFAYYNPGLQRDNIQMTNFPQGQTH